MEYKLKAVPRWNARTKTIGIRFTLLKWGECGGGWNDQRGVIWDDPYLAAAAVQAYNEYIPPPAALVAPLSPETTAALLAYVQVEQHCHCDGCELPLLDWQAQDDCSHCLRTSPAATGGSCSCDDGNQSLTGKMFALYSLYGDLEQWGCKRLAGRFEDTGIPQALHQRWARRTGQPERGE